MKWKQCALALTLLFSTSLWALSARVDRTEINLGESFRLILSVSSKQLDELPNTSVLNKNFTLLGTGRNSTVRIINGKRSSHNQWVITLLPKHLGKLTIPPIKVGSNKTQAITVTVNKSSASMKQQNDTKAPAVFVEATLNPKQAYVQSQLLYIVKLFYLPNANLEEGTLTKPTANNAEVTKLGNDLNYQVKRNNLSYQVIERRFAIFPQTSGKLVIQPSIFKGQMLDGGGANVWNQFFSNTSRPLQLTTAPITVNIKPKPFAMQPWLPAQELMLKQAWSETNPHFTVGKPITRTLTIAARGLTAAQLPQLTMGNVQNMNIYPNKPVLRNTFGNKAIIGIRREKVAYVPTQAGKITLPAINVTWWNTKTHKKMLSTLPTQSFTVTGTTAQTTRGTLKPGKTKPAKQLVLNNENDNKPTINYWPWLSALLGIILLLTVFYKRQRTMPKSTTQEEMEQKKSLRKLKLELKKACDSNNATQTKNCMAAWAAQRWPEQHYQSLGDIAKRVASKQLQQELNELDQQLYASEAKPWQGKMFWRAFKTELALAKKHKPGKSKNDLPSLYQ